ncbi:hypothetical protein D3C87_1712560 [compost metagenome]
MCAYRLYRSEAIFNKFGFIIGQVSLHCAIFQIGDGVGRTQFRNDCFQVSGKEVGIGFGHMLHWNITEQGLYLHERYALQLYQQQIVHFVPFLFGNRFPLLQVGFAQLFFGHHNFQRYYII